MEHEIVEEQEEPDGVGAAPGIEAAWHSGGHGDVAERKNRWNSQQLWIRVIEWLIWSNDVRALWAMEIDSVYEYILVWLKIILKWSAKF